MAQIHDALDCIHVIRYKKSEAHSWAVSKMMELHERGALSDEKCAAAMKAAEEPRTRVDCLTRLEVEVLGVLAIVASIAYYLLKIKGGP